MKCAYFEAGVCRSCSWIELPYAEQLAAKQDGVVRALEAAGVGAGADAHARGGVRWLAPVTSPVSGFRTTAKMAVGGTSERPTLGILDGDRRGVDLSGCPIIAPALRAAMPGFAQFIRQTRLLPYDVPRRAGELKYIVATSAAEGALLVRFVLRSRRQLEILRRGLPLLRRLVQGATVVTANIHPTHEAIIEGPEEVVLTAEQTLPLPIGDVTLHAGPRSFVQTNTAVAGELYRQVARWTSGTAPSSLWDLYCGIGGFALHAAAAGVAHVTGVELSEQAVDSARRSAEDLQHGRGEADRPERGGASGSATTEGPEPAGASVRFVAADATRWAREQASSGVGAPEAVVVNPPRRGIGAELATWLDRSGVPTVVYSSCFPATLARDLAAMPGLRPVRARLFDMFPHTPHAEVAVLLRRE